MAEPRKALRGRILRGQFTTSPSINKLIAKRGYGAFYLFAALICRCADDDGRFDADPEVLKGVCFPRQPYTLGEIEADLKTMSSLHMIRTYRCGGVRYGVLINWCKHQPKPQKDRYIPSERPSEKHKDALRGEKLNASERREEATVSQSAVNALPPVSDTTRYLNLVVPSITLPSGETDLANRQEEESQPQQRETKLTPEELAALEQAETVRRSKAPPADCWIDVAIAAEGATDV